MTTQLTLDAPPLPVAELMADAEFESWGPKLVTQTAMATIAEAPVALPEPAAPNLPAIQEGPGALLSAIVTLAKDSSVDVNKLQALMGMQERMEAREAERRFNAALMRLPAIYVKKNGTIDLTTKEDRAANRAGRSVPFARWEDMSKVIEPLLDAEGFRLSFDSVPRPGDGGGLIVTGTLLHQDGHSRSASMPLPLDTGPGRNNLQAQGSTLSYGRRYTAEMLLNIVRVGEDDDGKMAGVKFITQEQADELAEWAKEAGVQESSFLDRMASSTTGDPVRSYEEVEVKDHTRLANTLRLMAEKKKAKVGVAA